MVSIIGGGIAGLAAAFELTVRGVPFTLFEASDRLGGLIRTDHVDGFTIDAGADSMLTQKHAALDLCGELGLTTRLVAPKEPRTAFVLQGGRLYPLPSPSVLGLPGSWRDLAGYSLLPVHSRARVALEPLVPAKTHAGDESVAAFFRRRFGAVATERIAQPLLGGIHAGDIEKLSLPALFPRLAEAERSASKVLRWAQRTARAVDGRGAFWSLPSGMGELVEGILRRLPQGAVRRNSPVHSIEAHGREWLVRTPDGSSTFRAVILACPAHAVRGLLAGVDAGASEICGSVRYVSTISLGLAWPRAAIAHPLEGSGFVVARASSTVRITACTWVSSKWGGRAPAGHVLLRAYLGGAHDASAIEMSDGGLAEVAVRDLSAILSITDPPVLTRVYRWREAGAQHEVGHRQRLVELEERLAGHPGLFVTGSGFRSIGIPDCVADARAVASQAGMLCP